MVKSKDIIPFFVIILCIFLISMFLFADLSHKISRSFMNLGIISTASTNKLSTTQTSPMSCPPWNYKKQISMNNPSSTLTDYQVSVTLDTASLISAGKMRSDCGDIRFTDSDGTTPLNYWLESGCNSINTKLWVKVPSISAGSKIIYIYYGNPSASSESNGIATFDFFDDFNNLDNWDLGSRIGVNPTTSNGWIILTPGYEWDGDYIRSKNSFSFPNIMLETRYSLDGHPTYCNPCVDNFQTYFIKPGYTYPRDAANYNTITGIAPAPVFSHAFSPDPHDNSNSGTSAGSADTGNNIPSYPFDYPTSYWGVTLAKFPATIYRITYGITSTNVYAKAVKESDGSIMYDKNANVNAVHLNNFGTTTKIELIHWGYACKAGRIDFVFIRKFVSPEPTTSIGAEELCTSITTTASATTTNTITTTTTTSSMTTTVITTASTTTTTINTEPPNIGPLSFNPKRIVTLNQIINISSNITDKFGSVFVWMNVTKPNGNYYYLRPVSLPGNIYRFDITETDVIGDYDFSIAAVNVNNNLTVKNDRFYAGNLYKFKLYFKDGDNERVSVKYNLAIHPEGDNILSGEDRVVDRNIIEREYNLILEKNYVLLDLLLNISKDTSINVVIDELSQTVLDGISIPNSYKKLGYGINVSTDFMEGLVKLYYSDLDINEDNIITYKCNRWNIEDRVCDGSWKEVTYNIDKDKGFVEIPVYSFSAFVLAEYSPPPRTTRLTTTTTITTVTTTTTTVMTTTTTTVTTKAKKTTTTTVPEVELSSTQNWYIIVLFIVLVVVVFYFAWFRKYMVFEGLKKKWGRRYQRYFLLVIKL